MSWEIFKQNILRVSDSPESISSTDMIADLYAKEYDAAIKRGFDSTHKVTLKRGNVELMKKLFKLALDKGLTQSGEYDLVGAMGDGVLAYWAGAVMNEIPVPTIPATGATSNVSVTSNLIVSNGVWEKSIGGFDGDMMDDPGDDNAKIEFAAVEEYEIDNGEIAVPESIEEISEVLDDSTTYTEIVDNGGNTEGETPEEYITNPSSGGGINDDIDFIEVIDTPQTEEEKQAAIDAVKNLPPTKIYGKIGAATGPLSPPPGLPKGLVNGTIPANVLAPIGNGMILHKEAAVQYLKLKEQAQKDKIRFTISSAYRPLADQVRLYKKYPKGQAAKPGSSIHGWGCAIDFGEIANDCKVKGGGVDGRTLPSVNQKVRQTNPLYRWLSVYGPKYGWYNPARLCDNTGNDEAWHWEYWGFFVKHD
jgi:LAS superfamily LD-carboxypeptidase LdcB